jgi:hypothetical protein
MSKKSTKKASSIKVHLPPYPTRRSRRSAAKVKTKYQEEETSDQEEDCQQQQVPLSKHRKTLNKKPKRKSPSIKRSPLKDTSNKNKTCSSLISEMTKGMWSPNTEDWRVTGGIDY